MAIEKLQYFVNGEFKDSKTEVWYDLHNPSTGEVIAQTPCCTKEEVNHAVACAKEAFKSWSNVPVMKRVQVVFKFRELLEAHMDELTEICATEHGKVWNEA